MKFSSSKRDEFYDDNDGANNDDNDVDVDDVRLQTEQNKRLQTKMQSL